MTQVLTLDQCPPDVRAHFLGMPAFNQAMRITNSTSVETGTPSQAVKTLKTGHREPARKAANLPGFAQILGASVARDIGTPAPAIPKTPAPTTTPTDAVLARANAGGAGLTTRGANAPKTPIPSKHDPVTYASLQAAIDTAMAAQYIQRQHEAFNAGRSAFSRIAPTKKSDVQGGGSGDAWSLRQLGGKLASAVLNSTTRKADGGPVGSSALDIAFGRR